MTNGSRQRRKLLYVSLERLDVGSAPATHASRIQEGLRRAGWEVQSVSPSGPPARSLLGKLFAAIRTQARAAGASGRAVAYIRFHPAIAPLLIGLRARGNRIVVELNGTWYDSLQAYPGLKILSVALRASFRLGLGSADAVVAVTPGLAEWARQLAPQADIAVVPNAADLRRFRRLEEVEVPAHVRSMKPYVLFFGSFARWQGLGTLADAVMSEAWPSAVRAVVAGDGVERATLERVARKTDRLMLIGRIGQEDLPGWICGAFATLSPKSYEDPVGASPLKVYESLACGTPVIATPMAGQQELLMECRGGILVPKDDPVALAEAVSRLWRDPRRASEMGRRGEAAVRAHHTWAHRVEQILGVLEELETLPVGADG